MANYPYMNYQQPMGYNPYFQTGYQMAPQGAQQPVQQPVVPMTGNVAPQQPGIVCCPVTSRAEAEAQRVEALGPGLLMPDLGHGMIYYKKFNNQTALADFAEFKFVEPQSAPAEQPAPAAPAFDFTAIVGAFSTKFDEVEKKIDMIVERLPEKAEPEKVAETTSKGGSKK